MKDIHQVLVEPHITEVSTKNMVDPKTGVYRYVFKVYLDANKQEIRAAIEKRFSVQVDTIRTLIVRGKIKRVRVVAGKKSNWKKAYIKLKPGHKISEFEGT
ncbi:MAG TPA: 50S ribosomal protein L23 [Fibrobacteraceae bacterium]|nr:50S ribosomal protein L23 [Fibrobacteraceae bacterium]